MKNLYKRRKELWKTILTLLEADITISIVLIEELIRVDIEIEKGCNNECFRNEKTI